MAKFRLETTNEIIGSNSGIVLAGIILTGDAFKNQLSSMLGIKLSILGTIFPTMK